MTSDAELAAALQRGDDRALALLYERHKRPLYLFAVKMLGEADAARDLVQDVFLAIHERRDQLAHPDRFRSWLFAAARHRCLSVLRRERRLGSIEEAPEERLASPPPADEREAEEEVRLLRQALDALRVEYREVLILREYQDLSYREIAEITESTESAVKSRLFKARQALHEALRPAFTERSSGREL